ncbi:MAG: hypothetical protein IPG45_20700 [Deltaproteobacteria bacterium]|jgi:hypothetical protein|nr:hypothetical protein [Deltaproteobacteria bacterium]
MKLPPTILGLLLGCSVSGCAVMHRTTIGERFNDADTANTDVDVITSAIGVDTQGLSELSQDSLRSSGGSSGQQLAGIVAFVTWATSQSPRTGEPTATDDWAEANIPRLREQCVGGTLTGLQVVRESARYPYVSGEIVRVKGQCRIVRQEESNHASR